MPIPDEQRRQLAESLRDHDTRIAALNESIRNMSNEVRVHQTVLGLGRDAALLRALDELFDRPELAAQLAKRPKEYLIERGVTLPPDSEVRVTAAGRDVTTVELRIRDAPFDYSVVWDRHQGFYLQQS
jgi:hypothetical protein